MNNETTLSIRKYTNDPLKKRSRALLDILIVFVPIIAFGTAGTIIGTGTFPGGALVTLGYVVSIAVGGMVLKSRGTGWGEIGLGRPQSWRRTVLLSIGVLVIALIMNIAIQVIAINLPGAEIAPIDQSRFNPLSGNLPLLLLYVLLAWTTISFGEEMFYRAFLIDRLGEVTQNSKGRWALAVMGSALLFGLAHFVEGPLGMVNTAAMGLLFGAIYLRTGRNLWVTILAHALANTLRFVLLYFGAA